MKAVGAVEATRSVEAATAAAAERMAEAKVAMRGVPWAVTQEAAGAAAHAGAVARAAWVEMAATLVV
jgi:crotonobetainyl-CoA:carnitine CoA-transferase CaiB-like acyl-CoA transferase